MVLKEPRKIPSSITSYKVLIVFLFSNIGRRQRLDPITLPFIGQLRNHRVGPSSDQGSSETVRRQQRRQELHRRRRFRDEAAAVHRVVAEEDPELRPEVSAADHKNRRRRVPHETRVRGCEGPTSEKTNHRQPGPPGDQVRGPGDEADESGLANVKKAGHQHRVVEEQRDIDVNVDVEKFFHKNQFPEQGFESGPGSGCDTHEDQVRTLSSDGDVHGCDATAAVVTVNPL